LGGEYEAGYGSTSVTQSVDSERDTAMKLIQLPLKLIITAMIISACGPVATGLPATEAPATGAPFTEAPVIVAPDCPASQQTFNGGKAVTFALPSFALPDPSTSGVILQAIPTETPPTDNQEELLTSECGVIIGNLIAVRDLFLTDQQVLHEGKEYQIKVVANEDQQLFIHFINKDEGELTTSLAANLRTIESRDVDPPEASITLFDICYSWHHVQVCTEPSPSLTISDELAKIQDAMQAAVNALEVNGLLDVADINVAGTIPDMMGTEAENAQQASLLAAPTVNFPSQSGKEEPDDGALLGVVVVVLPIDKDGYSLSPGNYAVFAKLAGDNEWQGRFVAEDGVETFIPAKYVEVRGQIEAPLAIILDLRIFLCFFEC